MLLYWRCPWLLAAKRKKQLKLLLPLLKLLLLLKSHLLLPLKLLLPLLSMALLLLPLLLKALLLLLLPLVTNKFITYSTAVLKSRPWCRLLFFHTHGFLCCLDQIQHMPGVRSQVTFSNA